MDVRDLNKLVAGIVSRLGAPDGVRVDVERDPYADGWTVRAIRGNTVATGRVGSIELRSVYSSPGAMVDLLQLKLRNVIHHLFPVVVPFRIGTRHPKRLRTKPESRA